MPAFRQLLVFSLTLFSSALLLAQPPAGRGDDPRGPFTLADDPRVENRSYHFEPTGEDMPYSVFVSSKVSEETPAPLIITLHGLGVGAGFMLRGQALELAEEGGYILVGPMGYNISGWYGSPVINMNRDGRPVEPANLSELSEQDVMNVLALIRNEFNVDDERTYLMGHSMGGAGTFHLGVKHVDQWAAIAAIAPAAFMMEPSMFEAVGDRLPVLVIQGGQDELVPASNTCQWIDYMENNGIRHRYIEMEAAGHGDIIELGMPDIFDFFASHP